MLCICIIINVCIHFTADPSPTLNREWKRHHKRKRRKSCCCCFRCFHHQDHFSCLCEPRILLSEGRLLKSGISCTRYPLVKMAVSYCAEWGGYQYIFEWNPFFFLKYEQMKKKPKEPWASASIQARFFFCCDTANRWILPLFFLGQSP